MAISKDNEQFTDWVQVWDYNYTIKTLMKRGGLSVPTCAYCGIKLVRQRYLERVINDPSSNVYSIRIPPVPTDCGKFTYEHIVPPKRGGSYRDLRNMVMACSYCNSSKGQKTGTEFVKRLKEVGKFKGLFGVTEEYLQSVDLMYGITTTT